MFSTFSLNLHALIYDKHPKTFFVGGAVRNMLLFENILEVDIATVATPAQITALLKRNRIQFSDAYKSMGIIVAKHNREAIEIATFRTEEYGVNRFPNVSFTTDIIADSARRDFTINALYFNPITKEICDFHNGLKDIKLRKLRFIGSVKNRIVEDPLRIVRAYKFALDYNLKINLQTKKLLSKNLFLIQKVNTKRVEKEINKLKNKILKNKLRKVIHSNA